MAPKEWLRPPKSLLVILFLLTLGSVSALGWLGWRLLAQDRAVEAQREQERVEQAADQIAATLRGALAEAGERLSAWTPEPPPGAKSEDGLVLILGENFFAAYPSERLLYRPVRPTIPEAPADSFAEGELLEFLQAQPLRAAEWYGRAAGSPDPAIRAGALLRLGRVWRKLGRREESRAAYTRLAAVTGALAAGVPAELAAREALCELSGSLEEAAALQRDLLHARWPLTRGQFEFYWGEAARRAGASSPPPAELSALAEAAALAWDERKREANPRGQDILWTGNRPFLRIWRGSPARRTVWLASPESVLKPIFTANDAVCAAVDSEGRVLAGRKDGKGRAAIRTAAESQLPWTLYVTGAPAVADFASVARRRFLLLGMGVMVLFLVAGTYFIARAIRREAEVSRLQSDFVSAVSHEFRSPLTSMRQLSEILALGRAPTEDRKKLYYETLVSETTRLQRLVEGLLNFGRMEAGGRQYRFEELDAAAVVRRVAGEFEPQIAGSGRHIELHGEQGGCTIEADAEALSVALRNLVDNALKYSPHEPVVWVEWGNELGRVAIRVRDQGLGIAPSERKAIFRKFVRGSAAAAGNVKGSGVGLAMVRHIVAAHGGEIRVASEPGRGSTFTVLLPAGGRP
ncbi:MAG TPA: HAMP domain-containing sensor histidine kinase [Bryobacteraceae bacterium]